MGNEENYFSKLNRMAGEIEKKQDLTYMSWATAWEMVKKQFQDTQYKVYENSEGFPFWESKFGIDVKVGVTVNGIEHIVRLPVMNGANKAMKYEPYKYKVKQRNRDESKKQKKPVFEIIEKTVESATTFDINKTIQRALTKALAMHGVGLYVYRGEDLPSIDEEFIEKEQQKYFENLVSEIEMSANNVALELATENFKKDLAKNKNLISKEQLAKLGKIVKKRKDEFKNELSPKK